MADSINKIKNQQNTYLREVQQEKAALKRDLAAQQQQDLISLRQYYRDENKKIDDQSADAVNHIRTETKEQVSQYMDERRRNQEQARVEQEEQRQARLNEAGVTESATAKGTYDRQGKIKPTIQNHEPDKGSDEFYKVQNRGSRVVEKQNNYVIEAYAPAHEKENIQVSIHRDKAIVSGKRKFGDSIEDGDKKMSTSNFQTFREEFKFSRPVSSEGMTRERNGDYVRFTIPKLETLDKEG